MFRYLYRNYAGLIAGFVRKNNGSEEDAKEMIQTVVLELWQAVRDDRYNESGKLERFIYIITANTWKDELRKRKAKPVLPLDQTIQVADDHAESWISAVVKDRQIEAIHACLEQLENPCNQIIKLYHLKEIPLQELALQMDYDYNNLRKRIFDCRKKLKKLVRQYLQTTEA